jgi:hypothetical protein
MEVGVISGACGNVAVLLLIPEPPLNVSPTGSKLLN